MSVIVFESVFILLLIIANGVFALAEIATVSARRARLQQRANEGDAGARTALELIAEPTRFLSTVQIGITLVGILAGAFGGATIAEPIAASLARFPTLAPYSEAIGLVVVVLVITYLSLVIGELLPKRLALSDPERLAALVAPAMRWLSVVAAPVVHLLSASTEVLVRLLGIRPMKESPVTPEEIAILIEQGRDGGVFEATEQDIVESALWLDERRVGTLITPRTKIIWVDLDEALDNIQQVILNSPHAYFPAAHGHLDNVVGILRGRDLLARQLTGQPVEIQALLKAPLFVPETRLVLDILELLKQSGQHMAVVIDEFGGLQGIVTLTDVLETLVGEIRSPGGPAEPAAVRREDGSWLLDGRLPVYEMKELLDLNELPGEDESNYDTLGGFIMARLGRIPSAGEHFDYARHRFEVVDMDGMRVDQVLVTDLRAGSHTDEATAS
jgi:putative hemolysin